MTKDKTGFNDELSALNNEIKKMKEEFQPILKPLKDWQDDIGRKLYESNTKLTLLKEQNGAVKSTEAPNTEEKRQIDGIAKSFKGKIFNFCDQTSSLITDFMIIFPKCKTLKKERKNQD